MTTFEYEVVVPIKDEDEKVVELKTIKRDTGVWPKPTRDKLLVENAEAIKELKVDPSEVVTNIRPFCG